MTRYDSRVRALAFFLSATAGYVDAIGFIRLGGFFVSFMSGNSTRLAVSLAANSEKAVVAAGLIGAFMVGVVVGSLIGHFANHRRRQIVLMLVALILAGAAGLDAIGAAACATAVMAIAMGAENAVFEDEGEVRIGLTYMTGTLVKGGQRLAAALRGGDPFGWAPYVLQWLGLVIGAVCGALVYPWLGLGGLWIASAAMVLAAIVAGRISPPKPAIEPSKPK
jgi:uncharacterized membrane protein YoaK (UPF0700 family)